MNFGSRIKHKNTGLTQCLTCFALLCIYLGALPLFNFASAKSSNLVFCPLMKLWVKRGDFSRKSEKKTLKNICATEESKQDFFNESFQELFFTKIVLDSSQNEELFFNYSKEGSQAFAEISHSQNLPGPQFVKASNGEKSLISFQKDFAKKKSASFVLEQLARPPSFSASASFAGESVCELNQISHRIQPRAPPVSL